MKRRNPNKKSGERHSFLAAVWEEKLYIHVNICKYKWMHAYMYTHKYICKNKDWESGILIV